MVIHAYTSVARFMKNLRSLLIIFHPIPPVIPVVCSFKMPVMCWILFHVPRAE